MEEKASEKISKSLRCDVNLFLDLESRLSSVTGKKNVCNKIEEENKDLINGCFSELGIPHDAYFEEIYDALISKVESDDRRLFEGLSKPSVSSSEDCGRVISFMKSALGAEKGVFLKKEKAKQFLISIPPKKTIDYLGYNSAEDMIKNEDLYEIWSALRFIEGSEWLNGKFFKLYETLTPQDFEEREISAISLSQKWKKIAGEFVRKKWHNISHLKEMGVIFVIPESLDISGELLRMISLVFHYFREVSFYSDITKRILSDGDNFSKNYISLLRGDVINDFQKNNSKSLWLVIQRYLAKENENDPRLFYPHINPEAIHWSKVPKDLVSLGNAINGFSHELSFWTGLDWVGDNFRNKSNGFSEVSFNLVDTAMSLVKEKEMIKYLYHKEEALWNKVFSSYFSESELEEYSKKYLLKGWFEI